MKVISQPEKFKNFRTTCKNCDATLLIEAGDIQYYYFSDQRDGTSEYFYANCVLCQSQLAVLNEDIPPIMRHSLQKAKRGW
jgi:hypothetical protein